MTNIRLDGTEGAEAFGIGAGTKRLTQGGNLNRITEGVVP